MWVAFALALLQGVMAYGCGDAHPASKAFAWWCSGVCSGAGLIGLLERVVGRVLRRAYC